MDFLKKENVVIHFGLNFSELRSLFPDISDRFTLSSNSYEYLKLKLTKLPYVLRVSEKSDQNYSFENTMLAVEIENYEDIKISYHCIEKEIQNLYEAILKMSPEQIKDLENYNQEKMFCQLIEDIHYQLEIEKNYNTLNDKISSSDSPMKGKSKLPKI